MVRFKTRLFYITFFVLSIYIGCTEQLYSQGFEGYYRFPEIHDNTVYFTAEGDVWKVDLDGGLAQRLTTHGGQETHPAISPDGKTLAYSAQYEEVTDVYTMPSDGGSPTRWTYEQEYSIANSWSPDGKILYATRNFSSSPDLQLVTIDTQSKKKALIPLSQASEGSYNDTGKTVYFVRPAFHNNVTKRYKGGTARQIWKFTEGENEAVKLTTDYAGESHHPMWWNGRIYFITDRDGIMNIWSMDEKGMDIKQHTKHNLYDVRDAAISNGRIVYQRAGELWHYSIATDAYKKIPISLVSDLDQLREKWVQNPKKYITSVHPDPFGEKIVITARGRVFVAPVKEGRFTMPSTKKDVRYRDAIFDIEGKNVLSLSDESGEFEFVSIPSTGIGSQKSLTNDGKILRYKGVPSPDGKYLAYDDLNNDLWILDLKTKHQTKISTNNEGIGSFSWSPDSKWVSFAQYALNTMSQVFVHHISTGKQELITTDRANSISPVWSTDGKYIYFLSDRNFQSLVRSPWGSRQPDPYFDNKYKVFFIPLLKTTRPPFRDKDELFVERKKEKKEDKDKNEDEKDKKEGNSVKVTIDFENITKRIGEVPVQSGNYRNLQISDKALYLLSKGTGLKAKTDIKFISFEGNKTETKTLIHDVSQYELTLNKKKILVKKGDDYYMVSAGTSTMSDLGENKIDLSNWSFPLAPKEDWKQIFTDAWRMERDYFYDKNMHGVNWKAMYTKYLPIVDRITTREELSDLIGEFVGELSALHTSVRGGDTRKGSEKVKISSLGARFERDEKAEGYIIRYIYQADPDYPEERSPLDDPYLDISTGDVIKSINGTSTLSVPDINALLRNQLNNQVRVTIYDVSLKKDRDIIVQPTEKTYNLRYNDWEYTRRLQVEKETSDKVGYVHLRAMGPNDISQWYREFYPVFNRQGLIIDMRYNRGGNIDSFILEKLLRKAWMYWKGRSGEPTYNMQYAFTGHIVLLVNESTASDGEALAEGFRRLGLGKIIGKRTWGGEIWLSAVNKLSDGGVARAPMTGVYGSEGKWLIEGHGVEPDIEVDNLPHEAFNGKDAQLEAAISHILELIQKEPRLTPAPPEFPDKSFNNK